MNKEIVKRLEDSLDYEFDLSFSDRKELLSYIEQLEEEIHKKEAMYDSLAVDYRLSQEQNEQLENNRNEVAKEIIYMIDNCDISYYQGKKLENILMGDSDE